MTFSRDEDERPKPGWGRYLTWPTFLLLAWLLYELTAQPALGVAMICLKFGWEDFATAWWLRKRDKLNPGRGKALFWLYVASGLWTTAITATVMIFAYAFLAGLVMGRRPAGGGPPPHVIGALLTAFIGFGLSTLLTGWSLLLAVMFRVKVWLSSAVHVARRANVWPPRDTPGRGNKAVWLIITAMVLTLVPGIILVALFGVMLDGGGAAAPRTPGWLGVMLIVGLCGGPMLALAMRDFLARRVIAVSAKDCWPPDEVFPEEDGLGSHEVTEY